VNPDRIVELVRTVPGVADLHGGAFGEVATYVGGRRVIGLRVGGRGTDRVEIHLTAEYPADLPALADTVRTRVADHVDGVVDVVVEDVVAGTGAFGVSDSTRKQVPS